MLSRDLVHPKPKFVTEFDPCRRFEEFDLPLLTRLREEMPADTRVAFYLAQTLLALSRWEDAIAAFDVRLTMAPDSRSNPVSFLKPLAKCRR